MPQTFVREYKFEELAPVYMIFNYAWVQRIHRHSVNTYSLRREKNCERNFLRGKIQNILEKMREKR